MFAMFPALLLTTGYSPMEMIASLAQLKWGLYLVFTLMPCFTSGVMFVLPSASSGIFLTRRSSLVCSVLKGLTQQPQVADGPPLPLKAIAKDSRYLISGNGMQIAMVT